MEGRVIGVNRKTAFVAVTTDGGITVFELLGGYEIENDDIVSGELENHGGEIILNVTRQEKMDVFIQGVHCTHEFAQKLLE